MDKQNYITEAYRQLNDQKYYRKLTEPLNQNNVPRIGNILEGLRDLRHISHQQLEYLAVRVQSPHVFIFYQKFTGILSPGPKMPEGRPIDSDINSESFRVSEYIDSF